MTRFCVFAIVVALLPAATAAGQDRLVTPQGQGELVALDSRDAFDPELSTVFDFENFSASIPAATILSAWGILMPETPAATAALGTRSGLLGANFDTFVVLSPREEGPAEFPLIIDFQ